MQKVAVLWRHQKTQHPDEEEVRQILNTSSEVDRNKKINLLRFRGNFENNKIILKRGHGELIVGRRPAGEPYGVDDFMPCPRCLIFIIRADLKFHLRNGCLLKDETADVTITTKKAAYSSKALLDGEENAAAAQFPEFHAHVLARMNDDDIKVIVSRDELIMKFGALLYEKLGDRGFANISQRLRPVASVVHESSLETMSSLLSPENIDEAVRCAQVIGGLDKGQKNQHTELPVYGKPGKAMKIGGELRQLAELKKGVALEKRDVETAKEAEDFLSLVDLYWNSRVAHVALKTRDAKKYEKINVLPLTEDLKRFTEKSKEMLSSCTVPDTRSEFVDLSKKVLARLMVFNKRRPTEVSRVLLSSWMQRHDYKTESIQEIKKSMTKMETQLFDKLDVVMAIGKRGNKVPVLIPDDAQGAITALLSVRGEYVRSDNKFLLASPTNQSGHFPGCEALKSVIAEMGLEMPNYFTATRLRKYCGTTSQILSLTDNDFEVLTRHMGHDKNVHREFYRLPDSTLELTKAAVLMDCLDSGLVSKHAGEDLSTILNVDKDDLDAGVNEDADQDEEDAGQDVDDPTDQSDLEDRDPSPKKRKEKRSHVRFTVQQTNALQRLLETHGQVPKIGFLKTWVLRQGALFSGRSVAVVRSKLYYLQRMNRS